MIYTSRFSNPELRRECYTTVRIAIGTPKWDLGYRLNGEIKDLMPFGLLGKYDDDIEGFRREYIKRLDHVGVDRIRQQIQSFSGDVVLLCWEDVRKGDNNWCHRTMFAEWWQGQTGETIPELTDPSNHPASRASKGATKPPKPAKEETPIDTHCEQLQFSF